jgi:hypothetical protein
MANTLGTLSSSLILQEALSLVFTQRPELRMISKDLQPTNAKLNQTVISRTFAVPSVGDFPNGVQNKVDTDVPVTLNRFKQVGYEFTATELNSTDRNLIRESAQPLAIAMGNAIIDSVAALYTSGNYTNATTDASPGYDTLVTLRKALVSRGCQGPRWGLVNPDVYAALLNDPLCNRQYKDQGADPIADGLLPNIAGFTSLFEYPALPTTGNLTGFFGTAESVVLATRVPTDPREVLPMAPATANAEVITDPRSGFSVLAVEKVDYDNLSAKVYMAWIYGVAVGNATCGQRLISA